MYLVRIEVMTLKKKKRPIKNQVILFIVSSAVRVLVNNELWMPIVWDFGLCNIIKNISSKEQSVHRVFSIGEKFCW